MQLPRSPCSTIAGDLDCWLDSSGAALVVVLLVYLAATDAAAVLPFDPCGLPVVIGKVRKISLYPLDTATPSKWKTVVGALLLAQMHQRFCWKQKAAKVNLREESNVATVECPYPKQIANRH